MDYMFYFRKNKEQQLIHDNCKGLNKCSENIVEFGDAINNPDCPLAEDKIKKLFVCYNKYHEKDKIGEKILERKGGLMELLQDEEDTQDLQKAQEWVEEKIMMVPRNAVYKRGGFKTRKSKSKSKSKKKSIKNKNKNKKYKK